MHAEPQICRRVRAVASGGKVGVVSPASCVARAALEAGCEALSKLNGWQVETSPFALMEERGNFAGNAETRAAALTEMWLRDDIEAVICARGGYGSNYLLTLLDFDALRMRPKAFVGYSDNTMLLLALERAGLVAFHGPMVASDFGTGRADESSFRAVLGGKSLELSFDKQSPVRTLIPGEARGTITGGCLSLVVTSIGTPWEIHSAGKILFLEDVAEKPYRIDRMLMHLKLAGKFHGVRAIVFGMMRGCAPTAEAEEPIDSVILRVLGGLGIPIVTGFPSGHVHQGNITLPFGVPAELHASPDAVQLRVQPATFLATQSVNSL